jgi:hypothetical protein
MSAGKICQPRDHHTSVGDRLLKRCEIDAWIAGRVMCDGRQRVTIGLSDVLSRDLATRSRQRRLGRRGWAAAERHEAKSVVTASADVRQRQRCMRSSRLILPFMF